MKKLLIIGMSILLLAISSTSFAQNGGAYVEVPLPTPETANAVVVTTGSNQGLIIENPIIEFQIVLVVRGRILTIPPRNSFPNTTINPVNNVTNNMNDDMMMALPAVGADTTRMVKFYHK